MMRLHALKFAKFDLGTQHAIVASFKDGDREEHHIVKIDFQIDNNKALPGPEPAMAAKMLRKMASLIEEKYGQDE